MKRSQVVVWGCVAIAAAFMVWACSGGSSGGGTLNNGVNNGDNNGNNGNNGDNNGDNNGNNGDPGAHPILVAVAGDAVASGDTYFTPINAPGNTIPLFSEHPGELMTLRNQSGAAVTLDSMEIMPEGNGRSEEWRLATADIADTPLEVAGLTLGPDEVLDFYVRFQPVEGTVRNAVVNIVYNGGETYSFTMEGEGAPSATFLQADPAVEHLLGRSNEDEQFGAMAADAAGNTYFSFNHETANDSILIARMNPDGTLAWLKQFDGPFSDRQIDPGQNSETGGSAGSLQYADGFLYATGTYSWTASNNSFYTWAAKIDPADGALVWSNLWSRVESIGIASESSTVYSLDARAADRVFLVGATEGEAKVSVVALNKEDGSQLWAQAIELAPTLNDRAYAAAYAGGGVLYVSGQTAGNGGFLMQMTGTDGAAPEVAWTRRVELGTGGSLNSIDVDGDGNVYASFDIRGAATFFAFGSFDSQGALRWARGYTGLDGDKQNTHVIRYAGGKVYVGGRIAEPGMDGQMGDGNIVAVDPATGEHVWSANYYSGKGNTDLAEHRVKGIAVAGDKLIVGMQVYTGTMNGVRYAGYWYNGLGEVVEFTDPIQTGDIDAEATAVEGGGYVQAVTSDSELSADWKDATDLTWQKATDKKDGNPPDADAMIMVLDLP